MRHTAHPTPLLEREHWRDLSGAWRFCFEDACLWRHPSEVVFDQEIKVPYAPESPLSGLEDQNFHPVVWYGLTLTLTPEERAGRVLLHFGAVDYAATVWVDGHLVAEHEGGHTPFVADITRQAQTAETVELTVRAQDDPHDLTKPRGKQDWQREPHSIWYPRTTGIWQTVWLECMPETYIRRVNWSSDMDQWQIGVNLDIAGPLPLGLGVRVRLWRDEDLLVDDRYGVCTSEMERRIALADPGIDDFRNDLLWSPNHPQLLGACLELTDGERVVDRVYSYTAIRSVCVAGNRFLLNGRSYYLKMVLDQGWWEDVTAEMSGQRHRVGRRRGRDTWKVRPFIMIPRHPRRLACMCGVVWCLWAFLFHVVASIHPRKRHSQLMTTSYLASTSCVLLGIL